MDKLFNSPEEVVDLNIKAGVRKSNLPFIKMFLLGILAGMFIAIGGEASSLASHSVTNVGLARTITGAVFPVGLMMIVIVGGELFTGNTMIFMAVLQKETSMAKYIRNLVVVFISNLTGSLIIVFLTYFSGQWNYSGGGLGAYTIKVALGKVNLGFGTAFASGILCNILVCVAVLMAIAAKDIAGKVWGIFFPIFAFVISGFEHCVANMYYIPAGMIAKTNSVYTDKAFELYGITAENLENLNIFGMIKNMIPVTLGNIVGGAILVGALLIFINKKCKQNTKKEN